MIKKRESRFELLRIISMILIICFHAYNRIGIYDISGNEYHMVKDSASLSLNLVGLTVLGSWGLTGVGCFFLISSFFLQKKNSFSIKKTLMLIFETAFWSFVMLLISYIVGARPAENGLTVKAIAYSLLSPFVSEYWFVTAYLFMLILSPFLNRLIEKMDLIFYRRFIIILSIIIPGYSTLFDLRTTVCDLLLPIYYYFLWGYLKQKEFNFFEKNAKKILIITMSFVVFCELLGYVLGIENRILPRMNGRYSGFQIVIALSLFYIFKNMKLGTKKYINILSSGTLGVYLIHEKEFFCAYLWNKFFGLYDVFSSAYFIAHFIIAVVISFLVMDFLSIIRSRMLDKFISNMLLKFDNFFLKIDNFMNFSD